MPAALVKAAACLVLCGAVVLAAAGSDSRLITAVKDGDATLVRTLIQQHADVNAREIDGTTALHWAVQSDDRESVRRLIRAGARVNMSNRYGVTPLSLAATNGSPEIVRVLLESGADPDTASPEGETALMTAAKTGDPRSVLALLDYGADANAREQWLNETALMWAAAENHAEVARALIDYGADVDARSAQQEFARFRFNLATMVNTVLPRGGLTALMMAAREGALATARVLVASGANLNLTDPDGTSALMIAILNGHDDVGAVLLANGADLNLADASGMTAVYAAVDLHTQPPMINRPTRKPSGSVENLDLLAQLLARGADPNAALKAVLLARYHNTGDPQLGPGSTPLMRAAKSLDVPAMHVLLDAGADPTVTNRNSVTALMFAAGLGRNGFGGKSEAEALEAVTLCLDWGADINAVNSSGQTALHIAVQQSDAVVTLLATRGAKLDIRDRQGQTPLDVALGDASGGRGVAPARGAGPRASTAALLRQMMSGGPARGVPSAE